MLGISGTLAKVEGAKAWTISKKYKHVGARVMPWQYGTHNKLNKAKDKIRTRTAEGTSDFLKINFQGCIFRESEAKFTI